MARQQNIFALLEGEEGDDVTKLIERVAAKAQALPRPSKVDKKNKNEQQPHSSNISTKPLPADNVREERGRGRGGQGCGSGRGSGNDVKKFQNGHPIGYQQDHGWITVHRQDVRRSGGYQQNNGASGGYRRDNQLAGRYRQDNGRSNGFSQDNGWSDGYSQDNGSSDGYRGDNRHTDGYQPNYEKQSAGFAVQGNWQRQGSGHGRGRGIIGNKGFGNEVWAVEDNKQVEGEETKVDSGRPLRNGNRSYDGERRMNGRGNQEFRSRGGRSIGGREGKSNSRGQLSNSGETKEDLGKNNHAAPDRNAPVTPDVSKDAVCKERKHPQVGSNSPSENKTEAKRREQKNKMTLEEYEKLLVKKKVSLGISKTQVRKVPLDKDFESMQVVDKKMQEDIFNKMGSVKDKLKKKGSADKDEKVRKSVSVNGLLNLNYGERREQYLRRPRPWDEKEDVPVVPAIPESVPVFPAIQDPDQFPVFDRKQGSN